MGLLQIWGGHENFLDDGSCGSTAAADDDGSFW
jgi:hypothetical protein